MRQSGLLYVQAKEYLKQMIAGMAPHDKLPPRSTICKEQNVARITVDRAISELIGEGYLYTKNGSGTFVAETVQSENAPAAIQTWGIVVPHTDAFMFPQLIRGISDIATEYGINLLFCDTNDKYLLEKQHIEALIRSKVNGVIIVPSIEEDELRVVSYRALATANIPFVFCIRNIQGVSAPLIKSNEFQGSYIAVKHLLEHGYRSIAFVSQKRYSIVEQRFTGYAAALNEYGIPVNQSYVYMHSTFDEKSAAAEAVSMLLSQPERPDAIFCFNDYLASVLCDALNRAGLRVPADIALVSCDNTILCDLLPSKLTSVECTRYEIGHEAALELLRLSGYDSTLPPSAFAVGKLILLPQSLIIRESCGCVRNS